MMMLAVVIYKNTPTVVEPEPFEPCAPTISSSVKILGLHRTQYASVPMCTGPRLGVTQEEWDIVGLGHNGPGTQWA